MCAWIVDGGIFENRIPLVMMCFFFGYKIPRCSRFNTIDREQTITKKPSSIVLLCFSSISKTAQRSKPSHSRCESLPSLVLAHSLRHTCTRSPTAHDFSAHAPTRSQFTRTGDVCDALCDFCVCVCGVVAIRTRSARRHVILPGHRNFSARIGRGEDGPLSGSEASERNDSRLYNRSRYAR